MSKPNPLEPLDFLKVKRKEIAQQEGMPTGEDENPFAFLSTFMSGTSGAQVETEGENPFDVIGLNQPGRISGTEEFTSGARFVKGVGRGAIHPVRAFLHKGEVADLGFAGAFGEFLGAGLTFIPLFKAADAVLGGVGLLRTAELAAGKEMLYLSPFGATEAGARAAQIARGATAFAGFEAFAGETPSEAPRRALKGFVEGAAFEVAAIGVAKAWRSKFPKWKSTEPTVPLPETPQPPNTTIHPLALKLENWFRPGADDSEELIKAKLLEIRKPKEQLTSSFLTLMKNFMPGGSVILPGLTQKELVQLWKTAEEIGNLTLRPLRRIKDEDLFDVFVVDNDRTLLSPKLLGAKHASFEEMLDAAKESFDSQQLTISVTKLRGTTAGRWIPPGYSRPAEIKISTDSVVWNTYWAVSTLLHETMHHINYMTRLRLFGESFGVRDSYQNIEETLMPLLKEHLTREGFPERLQTAEVLSKGVAEFKEQLKKTSLEIIKREQRELFNITDEVLLTTNSNRFWRDGVPGQPDYYRVAHELFARAAEILFVDSEWAAREVPLIPKIVGQMIHDEAPKIRSLLSRESQHMVDLINAKWTFTSGKDLLTVFERGRPEFTKEQLLQLGKSRFVKGMRLFHDGKEYILDELKLGEVKWKVKGGSAASPVGELKIRDLSTGELKTVKPDQVTFPIVQDYAGRTAEITRAIEAALERDPQVIPVMIRRSVQIGDKYESGLTRAIIDTEGYTVFEGTAREWIKSLPREIQDRLIRNHGTLDPVNFELLADHLRWGHSSLQGQQELTLFADALDAVGSKGLVLRDKAGLNYQVLVHDQETLIQGEVSEAKGLAGRSGTGDTGVPIFFPRWEDMLDQILREAYVPETDMDYFRRAAKELYGKKLRGLIHPEVRQAEANVAHEIEAGTIRDDVEALTARAGFETNRLHDGSIELRDTNSKSVIGTFPDENYIASYVKESGINKGEGTLADFPGVPSYGGGAAPPRLNDPVFPPDVQVEPGAGSNKSLVNRLVDAQTIFAPIATALENFAKAAERRGLGPAYTKVYVPLHNAMLQVHRELSDVVRDSLGGLTYKDKLRQISNGLVSVSKKRYQTIVGHVEALTKGEIAKTGGLMVRAMTENEIRVAKLIEVRGLANDIPRLMATDRLVRATIKGNLATVINRMERIELSPEAQELLKFFKSMPKFKTKEEGMDALRLTDDEKWAIKLINDSRGAEKDKFSIYAVSRYASAPELRKGFKNGREQFAYDNKMSSKELGVSAIVSQTLEAAFNDSGLDPARHLTGYWPHLRMWVREGFVPNESLLPKEVSEWVSSRFRSGELNVYETDPLATVYKHLRGLYMKRHFDPVYKKARPILEGIKKVDPRVGDVMSEYALELMGRPHASFGKLQHAFTRTMEILFGKTPSPTLINDIISGLAAVTSAAVIPFRPALIARNFFESLQKVAPRTGLSYYWRALKFVTGAETRVEAYKAAMEAGAIRPGVQRLRSLHAAEELFGPKAPSAIHKYLNIFDKGYDWYQSADDWGRAIAYHSQRLRIMDHADSYMKGKISLDAFLDRAKINTFDPLDVAIAEELIKNGKIQETANHLGQVLSRETMTRYGYADHPAGWNSVVGRLFGQFGTWPVQYKDYVLQGLTRGSMKDRAEFAITHGAINGAIVTAGYGVGVNLSGWTGMQFYTGGPYADMAINIAKSLNGSDSERSLARHNLYANIPILGWMKTGNPRSIFLPGSYLIGDMHDAAQFLMNDEYFNAVMRGSGVRVMRPKEKNPLDFIFD